MTTSATSLEQACLNTVRGLAIDAVQKANSGHPGLPMGAAAMAHALWTRHLRHDPHAPDWFDRDRFILSAGHGCMLLYALLHLTGHGLTLEDLREFRQWGSRTPGHPENHLTPGVEMATGPLGQGIATAVGMAMAERFLASRYNREGHAVVDHFTYVLASDGDLMEGVTNEACSLAGHLRLGKLIVLYDDNRVTIDGGTDLCFSDDTEAKFRALGWEVFRVDGMSVAEVDAAVVEAKRDREAPTLVVCRTTIGYGSPNKAGKSAAHGSPLGPEEVALTKDNLGIPQEPAFYVPDDVRAFYARAVEEGALRRREWEARMDAYAVGFPVEAAELRRLIAGEWPEDWDAVLPSFSGPLATRDASGQVVNALSARFPTMVAGCADLAESVRTVIKGGGEFQADTPTGRNVSYGVREHAMAAAVNGMTLHGGVLPFGGTFLVFSDYCRPSLRLAALMECPSRFVFSHDSIGLGEDGPTHQPVEHAMSLRLIPNFNLMRPADGNETAACWAVAVRSRRTPSAILLTRQKVPALTPLDVRDHPAARGAYVLLEATGGAPQVVLIGTGSEVQLAVRARETLEADGIPTRVVSMPSWFLFDRESAEHRRSVLPAGVPTVSVEAGTTVGWSRYAQAHVGLDHFGASAPAERLFQEFGITAEAVVAAAKGLLGG